MMMNIANWFYVSPDLTFLILQEIRVARQDVLMLLSALPLPPENTAKPLWRSSA